MGLGRQDLYEETGLENEILDMVKRDLSWVCIEQYLQKNGFFSALMLIYQNEYFPCVWEKYTLTVKQLFYNKWEFNGGIYEKILGFL
ncbi:MAG: hypothetical protein K2O29_01285 [Ruminococcus sp.]|nr:hypothetical protein [Ruminococcus sp.]MDE7137080.1 hypothetical protein [Ruminococcus sp.]